MASLSVMDSTFCHTSAGQDLASHSSVLVKDASKRKRVNRKLKQCKLDARREQWLSQVTTIKHCKDNYQESSSSGKLDLGEVIHPENHDNLAFESRDITQYGSVKLDKALAHPHLCLLPAEHYKHEDPKGESSPSSSGSCISDCFGAEVSPKSVESDSPKSKVKRIGTDYGRESREKFINEMKSKNGTAGHSRRMTDAYDVVSHNTDEYGLDSEIEDWEAAAEALGVSVSNKDTSYTSSGEERAEEKVRLSLAHATLSESNTRTKAACEVLSRSSSGRAWRPDDAHRPASLPNLLKRQSLPAYLPQQRQQSVGMQKVLQDLLSGPSLCPICAEELDMTDSSFEPCTCGFQLCLFCHHRIASEDGRCPGCRRFYCPSSTATLAPSSVSC